MKKLVLAAAVAAVAGSANAATVYEGKALSYSIKGDWQIQLRQDVGTDQELDVEFDDLELKNKVVYELDNGMKAFGELDFGFKNAADKPAKTSSSQLEEAYVGIDFGAAKVAIGKMNFATDEFGVEMAYETATSEDLFEANSTDGDDVIRVDAALGAVTVVASTELEAKGEDSENGKSFDLFVSTEVAGLAVAAAYQTYEAAPGADSLDTVGVSASYAAGDLTVAADYSTNDDADQINLAAAFKVDAAKVAVGYTTISPDAGEDVAEWYANVTYKMAKNFSVFAEVADTDAENVDLGYLAGLRLKF